MKTIANLGTLIEAQKLQALMGSEGIDAFIPDEYSAGVAPHFFLTRAGVRLQVAEEDVDRAVEVINAVYAIAD